MLQRPRRNRKNSAIRNMIAETHLTVDNLIYPFFVVDGNGTKEEISSLSNNYRWSIDKLLFEVEECVKLGLNSFVLFPKVNDNLKDKTGTYSYNDNNFYLKIARKLKAEFPQICLMSDVALDPYSIDGHDGIVRNGKIVNDETLPVLGKMAVAQAHAGFDIIGPSDMMDGRVMFIRDALDDYDLTNVSIMSYTAKYASAFYGPFKKIPTDKKTYQMNPANAKEAIREAHLDETEGADFLMVKPALCYLDIIKTLAENSALPISAYNVSGEYAMLMAACQKGWLNIETAMPEMLLSMKRAGATAILTYFAKAFAELKTNKYL
ncbi:UNVERIFIED_CONTAM: hypothetical protein GTU68_043707 [Idotea baltica]|nr:hypothetical protein [Idotea baltica]